jgi:glycosyltransferase involved in cell wall biosynthesis
MPDFVDHVLVVDDGSTDGTAEVADRLRQERQQPVTVLRHPRNLGVGAAIRTGYLAALSLGCEVVAVMAGDGQMDPADLRRLAAPIARGEADYAKGNRLEKGRKPPEMPLIRYLGISALTSLTRVAAGYRHLGDSQSGYTAVSAACLEALPLDRLYHGYGYPNHLLILLGSAGMRVLDVPVRPIYGRGEVSRLRCWRVAPRIAWLLWRGYRWRTSHTRPAIS